MTIGVRWLIVAMALVTIFFAAPVGAQSQRDLDLCSGKTAKGSPINWDGVIEGCTRVLQSNPTYVARVLNARGLAYHQKGKYDLAVADFDKGLRLSKDREVKAGLRSNRGLSLTEKGDYDRAVADFIEAIKLNGKVALYHLNLGYTRRLAGDFDGALTAYGDAISLNPRFPLTYAGRGLVWRAKGDLERALSDYNEALRIDHKFVGALANRGLVFEGRGDFKNARIDYQEAVNLTVKEVISRTTQAVVVDTMSLRYQKMARVRLDALSSIDNSKELTGTKATEIPSNEGRRVALIIGNGGYPAGATLANPVNDAKAVAKALRGIHFDVSEAIDLSRTAMERSVQQFLIRSNSARIVVVFYAGHGMQIGGRNYLVPIDTDFANPEEVVKGAVDVDNLLAGLDDEIRTNIMIIDACRNNPLTQGSALAVKARAISVVSGLAPPSVPAKGGAFGAGTLIAFATAPGQVAYDGDGENSPFSVALARHISTPGLEVQQMLTRVRAEVVSATKSRQIPWSNSSLLGEVYLAGRP